MKNFKPGDKVIANQNAVDAYTKGKVYIVRSCEGLHVDTVLDDAGRDWNGWHIKYFDLYYPIKMRRKRV